MTIHPRFPAGDGLSETAPPPDGRPLLTVRSYADAIAAVAVLAEARFPITHVAIVGRGARTGENATGRYDVTLTGGERAAALRILHRAGVV
jgi:hypothetical protein